MNEHEIKEMEELADDAKQLLNTAVLFLPTARLAT